MSSLVAFAKRSAMWGIALVLVALAGSTTAKADSITYDVTATFSNGLTLSGDYVWDNGLGAATSYMFDLTSTAGPASCSDASGTLCTFSFALFDGNGSLSGTVEAVLSLLDPNNPQFTLGIYDPTLTYLLAEPETVTPTPTVRVPESAEITFLLLGLMMVVVGMRRANALGLVGN